MFVKSIMAFSAVLLLATTSFAHLAPSYDASLRRGGKITSNAMPGASERAPRSGYSFRGPWTREATYSGNHLISQGDTVIHGTWPANDPSGRKLVWWAKFGASSDDEPGKIKEAGTSAWVLVNSISAANDPQGKPNYQWRGWNGDIANNNAAAPWAVVPTWRNGAEGAYSFTHDDIGAMDFETAVRPGWRVASKFPDIKQGWGVFVGSMSESDWDQARQMVREGHEMFNHSMDHTSAANRWFIFNPGDIVTPGDPDIPHELRGLRVVGAWETRTHFEKGNTVQAQGWSNWVNWEVFNSGGQRAVIDRNGNWDNTTQWPAGSGLHPGMFTDTIELRNGIATISTVPFWEGLSPSDVGGPNRNGVYKITPRGSRTEVITIAATGQQMYVDREEGTISVNRVGWIEITDIVGDNAKYPWWNNSQLLPENHEKCPAVGGVRVSYIECDRGRPGLVLAINTANGWGAAELQRNVRDANVKINEEIYEKIEATAYFKDGKRSEYFGYPFDVYSEETHAYLESSGFVGARGGAKSGKPMSGDFFHPYRIDFDAFFIERRDWTPSSSGGNFVYPVNAHVLLGLNEMVDKIIETKGYMIREFHSVANIQAGQAWYNEDNNPDKWPVNDASKNVGGWWGGIAEFQLEAHYQFLQQKIDARQIVVYTPSEAIKYRTTANAVSGVNIVRSGNNYTLTVTAAPIAAKYQDEISVIIALESGTDKMAVEYSDGQSAYRRPVAMNAAGTRWSVNVNPYKGAATIIPDQDWGGPTFIQGQNNKSVARQTGVSFAGIQGGQISLNVVQGNYTAELYNVQGRMIGRTNINAANGVNPTGLRTDNLAKGMFILQVRNAEGASILQHRFMLR